jgi:hypothetical protein
MNLTGSQLAGDDFVQVVKTKCSLKPKNQLIEVLPRAARPAKVLWRWVQVGLPLCCESLTKIVYFVEPLGEPIQHGHLTWVY